MFPSVSSVVSAVTAVLASMLALHQADMHPTHLERSSVLTKNAGAQVPTQEGCPGDSDVDSFQSGRSVRLEQGEDSTFLMGYHIEVGFLRMLCVPRGL